MIKFTDSPARHELDHAITLKCIMNKELVEYALLIYN